MPVCITFSNIQHNEGLVAGSAIEENHGKVFSIQENDAANADMKGADGGAATC